MNDTQKLNVFFDNAGGVTLQVIGTDYQHYFASAQLAAQSIYSAIESKMSNSVDGITEGWEGNALDDGIELLDPTDDEIINGGYRAIYDINSFIAVVDECTKESWANMDDLSTALRDIDLNSPNS